MLCLVAIDRRSSMNLPDGFWAILYLGIWDNQGSFAYQKMGNQVCCFSSDL